MFSFRHDKTGFFSGLVLMMVVGGTVLATILLLIFGGWENYSTPMKWLWGTAWVVCIITVLVRIGIFRWQMLRSEKRKDDSQGEKQSLDLTSPPREVLHEPDDRER
jgi:hypothetical protein